MEVPTALMTKRYSINTARVHCLIICTGPDGKVVLVREFRRHNPQWKFPGGGSEEGETPLQAIIRELEEETGLTISEVDIVLLEIVEENDYQTYVFGGRVRSYTGLKQRGLENGEPSLEISQFREDAVMKQDLVDRHRRIATRVRAKLLAMGLEL